MFSGAKIVKIEIVGMSDDTNIINFEIFRVIRYFKMAFSNFQPLSMECLFEKEVCGK